MLQRTNLMAETTSEAKLDESVIPFFDSVSDLHNYRPTVSRCWKVNTIGRELKTGSMTR
jgi:hypothetical protein